MRSYCHNTICILLLMFSKIQPDDKPVGSKHGAEWMLYKVDLAGYLFTLYFNSVRLSSVKKGHNLPVF